MMKFIELFAGIGGFRYGLENNKGFRSEVIWETEVQQDMPDANELRDRRSEAFTCVWANEIDKYASQIYRKNYGEGELHEGDITKVETSQIPEHDLLVGGVPCQAWSIAGKRKGFEDSRGTMWFECFRIIEAKKPKFIILENVKGILSHNGGNSFERICECICELGYAIDFEVLNSKNFGVPQNRERVFIIGIRLDLLDKCQLF
ncbi:MAG: hypothetical protein B6242_16375 [Anaerolineaceae bacterium 4572_78]|nr:MAG: hypothetical protein B6242_16375 [Anaerolineaceae bacterium 4572_78]